MAADPFGLAPPPGIYHLRRRRTMMWKTTLIGSTALLLYTGALVRPRPTAVTSRATAGDGFSIHVTAPHMLSGHPMGPVHHWCKPISPEPIIQCLLTDTPDANAPLTGVEYIVAKSITRPLVTLGTWNANFHDHREEIATGRVQILDLPAEEAKKVADLVATTDGIIFHLWPTGDRIPTGAVEIGQSVGHRLMGREEYARSADSVSRTRRGK
jgi:hypothetical protein